MDHVRHLLEPGAGLLGDLPRPRAMRAIYDRLLARLVEETSKIKIGNGLEDGVLLGPLVSKRQYEQVLPRSMPPAKLRATVACGGPRRRPR